MLSCRSRPSSSTRPYYCACPQTPSTASRPNWLTPPEPPWSLERPNDPSHGDYATNGTPARTRSEARAADLAAEPAAAVSTSPRVERAEVAGPASSTCGWGRREPGRARGDHPRAATTARGLRRSASASRSRWSRRTRPARSRSRRRATVRTATRSHACSSVRLRRGRARVLLQRRRRADGAVPGVGGRQREGREPPEDGYHGAYITEVELEDPVGEMLKRIEESLERFRIHFDSWALQSEPGAAAAGDPASAGRVREGRCGLGALVRVWRRRRPRADPLGRWAADLSRRGRRLPRRQARARVRPRDLRPRCRPPRNTQLVRRDRAHVLGFDPERIGGAAVPAST